MKILQIFERMWLVAFGLSIFVAIFNVFKYQKFDNHVYMPIVCGILCVFLWRNLNNLDFLLTEITRTGHPNRQFWSKFLP